VQHELLVNRANQLIEKEHSGCRALLRDDKVFDCCVLLFCLMFFIQFKFSISFPLFQYDRSREIDRKLFSLQSKFNMWDFIEF
jgi:hypothetical protein